MKCWVLLLVAFAAAASGQNASERAPARRALVIGNLNYTKLPKAASADREALLMADVLGKAGFEVELVTDMRMPEFLTQTQNPWVAKVKPGDVCVFYFSGYAVNGGDDNYLLPVNFDPQGDEDLEQRAYHLAKMQELLQGKTEAEKIFVVEGSRALERAVSGLTGLGMREPDLQVSSETIFAFSAEAGQLQPKENSVARFTREVANGMAEPGLPLLDVFRSARQKVSNATQRNQVPLLRENLLRERFYFHAPKPVAPPVKEVTSVTPPRDTGPTPGFPALSKRDRQEYVWIPPGTFKMGCAAGDTKCSKDESPSHSVRISKGFWLGRTELTVDAYRDRYLDGNQRAMPAKPYWGWDQTDYPMVNVTWEEAGKYCAWAGGRLPTEAEWEYAARAGVAEQIYPGPYKEIREKANFHGETGNDKYDLIAPVRKFDPNAFGLFDMAGNVWEWVSDVYSETYYGASPPTDPPGPASGKEHAARGGSFDSDPEKHLRISIRRSFGKGGNSLGFRCALDDSPDTRSLLNLPSSLAR